MYWSPTVTCNGHEKYDPTMPFYEQCLIDYDLFRIFFNLLPPWGRGENAKMLCTRIFKVYFIVNFKIFIVNFQFYFAHILLCFILMYNFGICNLFLSDILYV